MTEPCTCTGPGFCPRHRFVKTEHLFSLCQTKEKYRSLWDRQLAEGTNPLETCSDWEQIGETHYRCKRCGQPYAANHVSLLPKERRCQLPQIAPTPSADCNTCGGAPQPVPQPTMLEKAKTFAAAAVDFVASGGDITGGRELEERQAKCGYCEYRDGMTCRICGCALAIKQRERAAHCPMGFWPANEYPWMPGANDEWLKQVAVAIPAYGKHELTHQAVQDCFREPVHVAVVDSKGDYAPVSREHVLRDGQKRGWGAACLMAMRMAVDRPSHTNYLVLLNNDVRLSERFFSGLLVAQAATGAGIVAACYSTGYGEQLHSGGFTGPAAAFAPRPLHRQPTRVDGTCVMFTKECLKRIGLFDVNVSPEYGWGLTTDMCIRAHQAGIKIVVTEAAYCEHLGGGCQTAKEFYGNLQSYRHGASREMEEGLSCKWGQSWRTLLASRVVPDGMPEITTRNLIYHITPFANNDVWLRNVRQLLKRICLFNGKKVVAICTGDGMVAPETVKAALEGHVDEFIEMPNDARLRERVSFEPLMDSIASTDPQTATFYAHAKGVATKGDPRGVTYWRNAMYHHLLDDWGTVGRLLTRHPCVGTHRTRQAIYPDGLVTNTWHYAGTFWWFRHDALFTQPDWRERIPDSGWGVEAYPGIVFPYEQAACVFMDEPVNCYNPANYRQPIED